jgi:hypothetical protein
MLDFSRYDKEKKLVLDELFSGDIYNSSKLFDKFNLSLNDELKKLYSKTKEEDYLKLKEFCSSYYKDALKVVLNACVEKKRNYQVLHEKNESKEKFTKAFRIFFMQSSIIVDVNDIIQNNEITNFSCAEINSILEVLDKKIINYDKPLNFLAVGQKFLDEATSDEYIDYICSLDSLSSKGCLWYNNFKLYNTKINELAKKVVNESVGKINLFQIAYYKISSKSLDEKISISDFTKMIVSAKKEPQSLLKFLEVSKYCLYDKDVIKKHILAQKTSDLELVKFFKYLDFSEEETKDIANKFIINENIEECVYISSYVKDSEVLVNLYNVIFKDFKKENLHNYSMFFKSVKGNKDFYNACELENLIKNICNVDEIFIEDILQNVPKENKEKIIENVVRYGKDKALLEVAKSFGCVIEIENKLIDEKLIKVCVDYVENVEGVRRFAELKNLIVYNAEIEDLMSFCETYYSTLTKEEKDFVTLKVSTSYDINFICDYLQINKNVDKRILISPCLNASKFKECIKFLQRVKLNDADFNYVVTGLKFITPKEERKKVLEELTKIKLNREGVTVNVRKEQ